MPQGRKAMFNGYSWSLDTFVDYAWASLGKLKVVLIVLLVVETLCVQVGSWRSRARTSAPPDLVQPSGS